MQFLTLLDNHSSHLSDDTTKEFEENNITYIPLAANTTPISPICQPVDGEINCIVKSIIKYYSHFTLENRFWRIRKRFSFETKIYH